MSKEISVVINTLNEESNIVDAIDSAKKLADEVIVVDMKSDDNTAELAKKSGAKVYSHERTGYVEPARNFAIQKAKYDWIFLLDTDERISESLAKKIKSIAQEDKYHYIAVPRKNIIFGKWIKNSRWWPDYNIRCFRKGYVEWGDEIHSVPITTGKGTDLLAESRYALKHYHYTSISQYIQRLDRYTSVQAKEREAEFDWKNLIKKPTSEFLSRYFFGNGYKDGIHGLALAGLQAFSEFIVELKVWEKTKFKKQKVSSIDVVKQMRESQKDVNYWLADLMYKKSNTFWEQIRRKLKI